MLFNFSLKNRFLFKNNHRISSHPKTLGFQAPEIEGIFEIQISY